MKRYRTIVADPPWPYNRKWWNNPNPQKREGRTERQGIWPPAFGFRLRERQEDVAMTEMQTQIKCEGGYWPESNDGFEKVQLDLALDASEGMIDVSTSSGRFLAAIPVGGVFDLLAEHFDG